MFDNPLPIYFFTKEHPFKTSNKRTHIPLPIKQFVPNWTKDVTIDKLLNTCKFKKRQNNLLKVIV